MKNENLTKRVGSHLMKKSVLVAAALFIATIAPAANALEGTLQIHHGQEKGSVGYTLAVHDQFSRRSPFGWNVSYNRISKVGVNWNDTDLFFDSNTIEAMATYRIQPKSYNKTVNALMFELQGGISLQLTENKFVWEDLDQERYFSKKNDINPALAFITHYRFNRKVKVQIGIKYYPTFSEFDGVGSVFAGFTYKFGNQFGY